MLVEDTELAEKLATGFDGLWHKAMRDLREIDFHPGTRADATVRARRVDPGEPKRGGR